MKTFVLVCLATLLGFVSAFVASWLNRHDVMASVVAAFWFSLLAGLVAAFVFGGVEIAERKGYSGGLAFLALLAFNVFAFIVILFLPSIAQPNRHRPELR